MRLGTYSRLESVDLKLERIWKKGTYISTYNQTDRQTGRQIERQIERHTDLWMNNL